MDRGRPIQRLRDELIGMIAAGEVVENPASAVKELIENSLDAGASSVTVEIRDGGISYLRVTDNGSGIAPGDIRMAFERHATSKIAEPDDLFDLRTLGFRGEALASIAAVSKVTLTTKREGENVGLRAVNEGGEILEIREAASPAGTTIVARELFYNTPVRRKFLKKPHTEAVKVADVVSRFILARPDTAFRLISNGKQVYASTGSGDLKSAIFSIYGRDTAANLVPVSSEGAVSVRGYVAVGDEARTSRARQTFIVNGRTIRSPLLSQALETGCKERVTIGHYPFCVLRLDMPGNMVDVNVHPNKLEVRFSDERLLFGRVCGAVSDSFPREAVESAPKMLLPEEHAPVKAAPAALHVFATVSEEGLAAAKSAVSGETIGKFPEVPAFEKTTPTEPEEKPKAALENPPAQQSLPLASVLPSPELFSTPARAHEDGALKESAAGAAIPGAIPFAPYPSPAAEAERTAPPADIRETERHSGMGSLSGYRFVGILFDTYILLENGTQAVFIDQHAAHERILYERLMREIDAGQGSQMLMVPQIVNVTLQDREKIEAYREEIAEAGYEIEEFGDDAYQIRAVPTILGEPEGRAAFLDLVDRLSELRVLSTKQKRRDAILQMACKKAIKGGDRISMQEVEALLQGMMRQDSPPTCPHGRPLMVTLSRKEIEKRFRRINA